jgi:hypothetical protein
MASLAELLDYDQRKKQMLSALQAGTDVINRGTIAGTLGTPVDLVNTALQAVGLGSEKPVLGSEWIGDKMQQAGMVSPERRPVAEFAAGFVNPETAATKGVMLAKALASKTAPLHAIFIGANAKTWDKAAHQAALEMEKTGATPEQIWEKTGNWKGPDKEWRQEIPDVEAKFNDPKKILEAAQAEKERIAAMRQQSKDIAKGLKTQPDLFEKDLKKWNTANRAAAKGAEEKLNQNYGLTHNPQYFGNYAPIAYEHAGLYEAYPDLFKIVIRQGGPDEFIGAYTPGSKGDVGSVDISRRAFGSGHTPESTTAHEMQHAVQMQERFGVGGSPEMMMRIIADKRNKLADLTRTDDFKKGMALQNELNNRIMETPSSSDNPYDIPKHLLDEHDKINRDNPILDQWRKLSQEIKDLEELGPTELYRRLGGEAEARAVQNRLKFTPEQRRKVFPELSYDVPVDKLLISKTGYF